MELALITASQNKVTIIIGRHSRMLLAGIRKKSLDARLRGHDEWEMDTHLCGTVLRIEMKRKEANLLVSTAVLSVGGQVAEDLFDRGLCLTSGTAMTEEDLERILEVIGRICRRLG